MMCTVCLLHTTTNILSVSFHTIQNTQTFPLRVIMKVTDKSSFANINDVKTTHLVFDWTVDFAKKVISGSVELHMSVCAADVSKVVLDTRELAVSSVLVDDKAATFALGDATEQFGAPLTITLPQAAKEGDALRVRVSYVTAPTASALQWLEPAQTADKQHPYLFSQCQAIHCRSIAPVQDSPSIKATYEARVRVPAPLVVLMSAMNDVKESQTGDEKCYQFKQHIPMPSYLVAIVVGALESRDIGPRSRVWSEASVVDKAAFEFADTEKFLKAGEAMLGAYAWGRYDLLCLPPSFNYGGMENPTITFVTPTLLAGDRSLANVVAHEIAHSWTGNLVTNLTWEDFWLNEGFTVYVERAICAAVYGEERRDFAAVIGRKALRESVEQFGAEHEFTKLIPNLDNVDPDDSFSSIPYMKGSELLNLIGEKVGGRDKFDAFLKLYIAKFARQNVTTAQFIAFLREHFASPDEKAGLDSIDWDTWLHKPGMPPTLVKLDTKLSSAATDLALKWRAHDKAPETTPAPPSDAAATPFAGQVMVLLDALSDEPLSHETLEKLDAALQLSQSTNAEIRFRWYVLGLAANYSKVHDGVVDLITSVGRMKFVRPLYRQLHKSSPEGKQLAEQTFAKHKNFYSIVTTKLVAKDLGLKL